MVGNLFGGARRWRVRWLGPDGPHEMLVRRALARAGPSWELEPPGSARAPDLVLMDAAAARHADPWREWQALGDAARVALVDDPVEASSARVIALGADAVWEWAALDHVDLRELVVVAQRARIDRLHAELARARPLRGLAAAGRLAEAVGHPLANSMQAVLGHAQLARDAAESVRPDLDAVLAAARDSREILRRLSGLVHVLENPGRGLLARDRDLLLPLLESIQPRGSALTFRGHALLEEVALGTDALAWLLIELVSLARRALPRGGAVELAAERGSRGGAAEIVLLLRARGEPAPDASDVELEHSLAVLREAAADLGASVVAGPCTSGSLRLETWLAALAMPGGGAARARVLHVAVEDAAAGAVVAMLAELEFSVTRARDAVEALHVVARGSIDVVLLDENISDLPAGTLARQIAALDPHLPIVLASAFAGGFEDCADLALHRIDKPYSSRSLDAALRGALSSRATSESAEKTGRR